MCPFSHTVTLSLQNILKEKLHIHQKCFFKQFEIFHEQMHTSFKTGNFGPQGPQNAALQQRYSPC